jgi:hypothetical protein
MGDIGIDISGVQDVDVARGDWMFVVVKSTEDTRVVNPKVDAQWEAIAPGVRRGLYHYARPRVATPAAQVAAFCHDAQARGFRPGEDMWQLDCEGELNAGVTADEWETFVNVFMDLTLERLGHLGFLYIGRSFISPAVTDRLTARFNWWLPDYNVNDGTLHALAPNVNPVIHQFTSKFPALDRNVIHDEVRWRRLTNGAAPPSATQEDKKLILVPRLARPTKPVPPGRVAHIRFDREKKTLTSLGYDFKRGTVGWEIAEAFGFVVATLKLPTQGNNADLDFAETPDGTAVIIAAAGDFGTFSLPYASVG